MLSRLPQHTGNGVLSHAVQGRIQGGDRVGFVLPSAGIVAAIGGFNVAHVDSQRCVKETLSAKPGRWVTVLCGTVAASSAAVNKIWP